MLSCSGDMYFNGIPFMHTPAHERVPLGIVQVPEGRRLFPVMTVEENLLLGRPTRRPGNTARRAWRTCTISSPG